ncbi:hypothetical protein QCE73_37135 [Caballeronia sp. LZ029]|uniref:hypothetical protein n=1 Tax=Caballeronia sp. LZ029 TaxID=3038564 RepID=UPI00285EB478|nr:hypothetical protein [Caballeronia sp. LZ029]MDR5748808.1 hypothetical protein [Caballeronia sp. LZ029]
MSTLTIVDLPCQERELTRAEMAHVVGGHDIEKEKALVEAYRVIASMNALENEPDPAPPHVGMKL